MKKMSCKDERKTKIQVRIISYGLVEEERRDTLEARMVNKRLDDLAAEFERNGIATHIIKR